MLGQRSILLRERHSPFLVKRDRRLYRRSPCVIAAWVSDQLVFENYVTRVRVAAAPVTCEVLDACSEWRTEEELARLLPHYQDKSVRAALRQLVRATLLQSSQRIDPIEENIHLWGHWRPSAACFHFATKDCNYEPDQALLVRHFHALARRIPMPSPVKRYPQAPSFALLSPAGDDNFKKLLLSRRTWRRFSSKAISYQDLSTLFWLTFRVQAWADFYGMGKLAFKTSPSGGARHPIEAYLVARNVKGLRQGIYHYAAETHELERLRDLPGKRLLQSLTPTQDWCSEAAAMVLMTAVFARSQWKYAAPRAYRVILADAGHICQTFCLTATSLGLAPYCTMAFADTKIERLLDIDGVSEGAIYLAGVGARPEDVSSGKFLVPNSDVPVDASGSRPRRSTKAAKRGSERRTS